jgi:hypothetical protein
VEFKGYIHHAEEVIDDAALACFELPTVAIAISPCNRAQNWRFYDHRPANLAADRYFGC